MENVKRQGEQEIKIRINKESAEIVETPDESPSVVLSAEDAEQAEVAVKEKESFSIRAKLPLSFLRPCFSDADFRRSFSRRSVCFRQGHSSFGGILLTAFFGFCPPFKGER